MTRQRVERWWTGVTVIAVAGLILIAGCQKQVEQAEAEKGTAEQASKSQAALEAATQAAADPSAAEAVELEILCGSSFVEPTTELLGKFTKETGIAAVASYAGSEDFLPLVKAGRQGDVLITHDPFLEYVDEAGALAGHTMVGYVAPVLAVQPGNPQALTRIEDLTKPDLRVALSNPMYSTCGEMVRDLLKAKNIYDDVMTNVENRLTKGHSQLGNYLKTDAVDAVVMWNGVANTFGDALEVVKTPYEYDNEIRVHIIGLAYSEHAEAVEKLIAFAKAHGEEIFTQHGYVK